jgi:hypothetical protein
MSPKWKGCDQFRLDVRALGPVMRIFLKLAEPAMYHKSSSLRQAALEVLSNAVYVSPEIVLPVVVRRFRDAMTATDSVHQLAGAIRALSGTQFHAT